MSRQRSGSSPMDPLGFAPLIVEFLDWMEARNYSPSTVLTRKSHLEQFQSWCEERGITQPRELTPPILERYRQWLHHLRQRDGRPLAWATQAQRLTGVKVFLRYLARRHVLLYNPAADLEMPRLPHRLPRAVLTVAEVEQVLAQPDVGTPLGLRDRAILETLYSTGIRRSELLGLELYDLDLERGTVLVRQGKGQKDRTLPIGARAAAWVERYVREARPLLVIDRGELALFVSRRGGPLRPSAATELCHRYVRAAGVGKAGACHLFRHTMATAMLEGGADIRYIQEMLGHAKVTTTEVYTRVSIRKLQEVHCRTHPGAELGRHRSPAAEQEKAAAAAELWEALAAEASEEDAAGDA